MIPVSEIEKVIAQIEANELMARENKQEKRMYPTEKQYYNGVERGYKTAKEMLKELLPK